MKDGRYQFYFSDEVNGLDVPFNPSGDLLFRLANFTRSDDAVAIGIPFSGAETIKAYLNSYGQGDRIRADRPEQIKRLTAVNSLAAVVAGNGDRVWQDRTNNMVWIYVKSPTRYDDPIDMDTIDLGILHRGTWVRVFSCSHATTGMRADDPARQSCP